jgi:hypothetical protein
VGRPGAEARGIIEAFIRSHLPEGSADAYTDDEPTAFNPGSREHFTPYR